MKSAEFRTQRCDRFSALEGCHNMNGAWMGPPSLPFLSRKRSHPCAKSTVLLTVQLNSTGRALQRHTFCLARQIFPTGGALPIHNGNVVCFYSNFRFRRTAVAHGIVHWVNLSCWVKVRIVFTFILMKEQVPWCTAYFMLSGSCGHCHEWSAVAPALTWGLDPAWYGIIDLEYSGRQCWEK